MYILIRSLNCININIKILVTCLGKLNMGTVPVGYKNIIIIMT